jgi:hypothetical protein
MPETMHVLYARLSVAAQRRDPAALERLAWEMFGELGSEDHEIAQLRATIHGLTSSSRNQ